MTPMQIYKHMPDRRCDRCTVIALGPRTKSHAVDVGRDATILKGGIPLPLLLLSSSSSSTAAAATTISTSTRTAAGTRLAPGRALVIVMVLTLILKLALAPVLLLPRIGTRRPLYSYTVALGPRTEIARDRCRSTLLRSGIPLQPQLLRFLVLLLLLLLLLLVLVLVLPLLLN